MYILIYFQIILFYEKMCIKIGVIDLILKKLIIKNYRNFSEININLNNRNAIFGMNDVGKTNLLQAIRTVFDRNIRSNGFVASDYHKNDTSKPIEIIVEFDLSDREEESEQGIDSKILITKVYNARNNMNSPDSFAIKLEGIYDENEFFGNPILTWGSTTDNLEPIPNRGQSFIIDSIFHVEYVYPNSDLDYLFKKNRRQIFTNDTKSSHDIDKEEAIEKNIEELNKNVSEMDVVKNVQKELTEGYKKFRNEELKIELQSEVSISGYLDNLIPYIKWNDDDNYYPTGGDGRKKILSYALTNIITEKIFNKKIVIYLIEEPENNLHRSMQVALSRQLFDQQVYKYFFLTTHSSEILYEMDNIQLIRISNSGNSFGKSTHYHVPEEYENIKKQLNKGLSQAIFYNKILLVEGGSEFSLFESVLSFVYPHMEVNSKYILQVDGINFKPYTELFDELNINYLVKTDNDIQRIKGSSNDFILTGFNRCLNIIGLENEQNISFKIPEEYSKSERRKTIQNKKKELYQEKIGVVQDLMARDIYLSEIDLENDLYAIIPDELDEVSGQSEAVTWLQSKKLYNMIEFVQFMDEELAEKIVAGFQVLKEFIKDEQ